MKIERKKGLKGVKVHHNKGVFWTAVVLFIILIAVVVALKNMDRKARGVECSSDSDCVIVQTGACSCSMGGSDKCASKSEAGNYSSVQPANPEKGEIICAAVFNCKIKSCSCVSGKCFGLEE